MPFNDYPQITTHPQTQAIGALGDIAGPAVTRMAAVAPVWKFSKTPAVMGGPAPALGAHTEEILEELGLAPADVQLLRARGVVA